MSNNINKVGDLSLIENKLFEHYQKNDINKNVDYKIEKIFNYEDRLFVLFSRINRKNISIDNSENEDQNCLYLFTIKKDGRVIDRNNFVNDDNVPLELYEFLKYIGLNGNEFKIGNLGNGTYKNSILYNSKYFDYSFNEMTDNTNADIWSRVYRKLVNDGKNNKVTFYYVDPTKEKATGTNNFIINENDSNIDQYITQYRERDSTSSTNYGTSYGRVGSNSSLNDRYSQFINNEEMTEEEKKEWNTLSKMSDTNRYLYNYEYFTDAFGEEFYVFDTYSFNDRVYSRDEEDTTTEGQINVYKLFPFVEETYLGGLYYRSTYDYEHSWKYHDNAFVKDYFMSTNLDDNYLNYGHNPFLCDMFYFNIFSDCSQPTIQNNYEFRASLGASSFAGYSMLFYRDKDENNNDYLFKSNEWEPNNEFINNGTYLYSVYNYKYDSENNKISYDFINSNNWLNNSAFNNYDKIKFDNSNLPYINLTKNNLRGFYSLVRLFDLQKLNEYFHFLDIEKEYIFNNLTDEYISKMTQNEFDCFVNTFNDCNILRLLPTDEKNDETGEIYRYNIEIATHIEYGNWRWEKILLFLHKRINNNRFYTKPLNIPYRSSVHINCINRAQDDAYYSENNEKWSPTVWDPSMTNFFYKNNNQIINSKDSLAYTNLLSVNWCDDFINSESNYKYKRNCNFYDIYSDIKENINENLKIDLENDTTILLQDSNTLNKVLAEKENTNYHISDEELPPQFNRTNGKDDRYYRLTDIYFSIINYYTVTNKNNPDIEDMCIFNNKTLENFKNYKYLYLCIKNDKKLNSIDTSLHLDNDKVDIYNENDIFLILDRLEINEYLNNTLMKSIINDINNGIEVDSEKKNILRHIFKMVYIMSDYSNCYFMFSNNNYNTIVPNGIYNYHLFGIVLPESSLDFKTQLNNLGIYTLQQYNFEDESLYSSGISNMTKDNMKQHLSNTNSIWMVHNSYNQINTDNMKFIGYYDNELDVNEIENGDYYLLEKNNVQKLFYKVNDIIYETTNFSSLPIFRPIKMVNQCYNLEIGTVQNVSNLYINNYFYNQYKEYGSYTNIFNSDHPILILNNTEKINVSQIFNSDMNFIFFTDIIKKMKSYNDSKYWWLLDNNELYFIVFNDIDDPNNPKLDIYGSKFTKDIRKFESNFSCYSERELNCNTSDKYIEIDNNNFYLQVHTYENTNFFDNPIFINAFCMYVTKMKTYDKNGNNISDIVIGSNDNYSTSFYYSVYDNNNTDQRIKSINSESWVRKIFGEDERKFCYIQEVTNKEDIISSIQNYIPQLTSAVFENGTVLKEKSVRLLLTTNQSMKVLNDYKNKNDNSLISINDFLNQYLLRDNRYSYYKSKENNYISFIKENDNFEKVDNISYIEKYIGINGSDQNYSLSIKYGNVISNFNLNKSNDPNFKEFFTIKEYAMIPQSNLSANKYVFLTNSNDNEGDNDKSRKQISILKNNEILKCDLEGYVNNPSGENYKNYFKFLNNNDKLYSYINNNSLSEIDNIKTYLTNSEIEEFYDGKYIDLENLLDDKIPFSKLTIDYYEKSVTINGQTYSSKNPEVYVTHDNKEYFIINENEYEIFKNDNGYYIILSGNTAPKYISYSQEEQDFYFVLKNNKFIILETDKNNNGSFSKLVAIINFVLPNKTYPDIMISGSEKAILITTKDFYDSSIFSKDKNYYDAKNITKDKSFIPALLLDINLVQNLLSYINLQYSKTNSLIFDIDLINDENNNYKFYDYNLFFYLDEMMEETSIIDDNKNSNYDINNQKVIIDKLNKINYIKLYDIFEKERNIVDDTIDDSDYRLFIGFYGRMLVSDTLFNLNGKNDIIELCDFYTLNGNINEIYIEEVDVDNNNLLVVATDRSELYIFDNLFAYNSSKNYNKRFIDYTTFSKDKVLKTNCLKYLYNFNNEFLYAEDGRKLYRETHYPKILYIGSGIDSVSICDKYLNTLNTEYKMEDEIRLKNSIKYFKLKNDLVIDDAEIVPEGKQYNLNGFMNDEGSYIKIESFKQSEDNNYFSIHNAEIINNISNINEEKVTGNIYMLNLRIKISRNEILTGDRCYQLNISLLNSNDKEIVGYIKKLNSQETNKDGFILNHYTSPESNENNFMNFIKFEEDGIFKNIYFYLPENELAINPFESIYPFEFDYKFKYHIIDTNFLNEYTNNTLQVFPSRLQFRDFSFINIDCSEDNKNHIGDSNRIFFRYRYINTYNYTNLNKDIYLIVSSIKRGYNGIINYINSKINSEFSFDKDFFKIIKLDNNSINYQWDSVDIDYNYWMEYINGGKNIKITSMFVIKENDNYKLLNENCVQVIELDLDQLPTKKISNKILHTSYEEIYNFNENYTGDKLSYNNKLYITTRLSLPEKRIYEDSDFIQAYFKEVLGFDDYEEFNEYLLSKILEKDNINNRLLNIKDGSFSIQDEDYIKYNHDIQDTWIKENFMPLKTTLYDNEVPLNINERYFNGMRINVYSNHSGMIDVSQKLDSNLHYGEEKRLIPSVYVNGLKLFNSLFMYRDNLNNSESIYIPFENLTQYIPHTKEHLDLQTLYAEAFQKVKTIYDKEQRYNYLSTKVNKTEEELEELEDLDNEYKNKINTRDKVMINLEPTLTNIEVETKFGDISDEEKLLCTIEVNLNETLPSDKVINNFKQINVRQIVKSLNDEGACFISNISNENIEPDDDNNELSIDIDSNPNIFIDKLTLVFKEPEFKEDYLRNFVNSNEINVYISYNDENNKYARRINPKFVNMTVDDNTNEVTISIKGFYQYKNITHIYLVTGNIINHNMFFANIDREIEYIDLADIVTDKGNQIFKYLSYDEIIQSKELEIVANGYTLYPNIDYTILNNELSNNENIVIFRDIIPDNGNISVEINLLPNNTSEYVYKTYQAFALKQTNLSIKGKDNNISITERRPIAKYITLDNDKYQFIDNDTKKFSLFINNRKVPSDLIKVVNTKTINLSMDDTEDYAIDYRKTHLAKLNRTKNKWELTENYMNRNDGYNKFRAFDPSYKNIMIVFQKSEYPYNYEISLEKKYNNKDNIISLLDNLLVTSCYNPPNKNDIYDNFDWLCETNGGNSQNINDTLKLNALFKDIYVYDCNLDNLDTNIVLDGEFFESKKINDNIYIDCNYNLEEDE